METCTLTDLTEDTLHLFIEHLRHIGDFKQQYRGEKDNSTTAQAFADLVTWWDNRSGTLSTRDFEIGSVLREHAKSQSRLYWGVHNRWNRRWRSWLCFGHLAGLILLVCYLLGFYAYFFDHGVEVHPSLRLCCSLLLHVAPCCFWGLQLGNPHGLCNVCGKDGCLCNSCGPWIPIPWGPFREGVYWPQKECKYSPQGNCQ